MRHYLIKSRIISDAWERIILEYDSMAILGKELIEVRGGKLLAEYVGATEAVTYSIIQFPKSPAKLLYEMLEIGIYAEIEFIELITKNDFQKVMDKILTEYE